MKNNLQTINIKSKSNKEVCNVIEKYYAENNILYIKKFHLQEIDNPPADMVIIDEKLYLYKFENCFLRKEKTIINIDEAYFKRNISRFYEYFIKNLLIEK